MLEKNLEKRRLFLFFSCFFDIMESRVYGNRPIPTYYNTKHGKGEEMFSFLSSFFEKKQIDCYGAIPLSACRIVKPYLLEQEGIESGSVILLAIPYYTPACDDPNRNISAYAVSKDYHFYFKKLFEELLPLLREAYPACKFAAFADHSPIDEPDAAAKAGLGIRGKNHLLITPKYSSYVFFGEIITDMELPCRAGEIKECENCGRCMSRCPFEESNGCLSALTQKKGELTASEAATILRHGSAWGCDICQEVCPHTQRARQSGSIYSPIPYFAEEPIPCLHTESLASMSEEAFSLRAYAWRKKETILRNLNLLEQSQKKGEPPCST